MMTLYEFVSELKCPVVYLVNSIYPGGEEIALLEETNLGFDPAHVIGEIRHGLFIADDPSKFSDPRGNTYDLIQAYEDPDIFHQQLVEYATENGFGDSVREYVLKQGGPEAVALYDSLKTV